MPPRPVGQLQNEPYKPYFSAAYPHNNYNIFFASLLHAPLIEIINFNNYTGTKITLKLHSLFVYIQIIAGY